MTDALQSSTSDALAESGRPFSRADVETLFSSADLLVVGRLGEMARRRASGDTVTFGRVAVVTPTDIPASPGDAGEVRLLGSIDHADAVTERVHRARECAGDRPLTGFSVAELLRVTGRRLDELTRLAEKLRAAGLEAVAECAIDAFASAEDAIEVTTALVNGGLGVWRVIVEEAEFTARLALIERARTLHDATGDVRAFAPLPRRDPADQPATGYDDVRTVAAARLMCPSIPHIQVDWALYGPKLAQVALLYGANDIDGVAPIDVSGLGTRRSPLEDIRRQIRAAAATPVERNGRYERLP